MTIGILEPINFSKSAISELKKLGEVLYLQDNVEAFVKDIDILFVRLGYFIGRDFLSNASKLRIICSPTTGLNHIDIKETKRRNISIISLKGEFEFLNSIRATPEHTFGLVLALMRKYKNAFLDQGNKEWDRNQHFGEEVFNNKIGILGFGRIGKLLAKYFLAFDAKVYFFDINSNVQPHFGAIKCNSVPELIAKSNVVILCASYNHNQDPIFDNEHFKLMKDKYFINTSRGELVNEEALLNYIRNNYFKGVAIDVIDSESKHNKLDKFLELTKDKNLIITSHIGGATYTSLNRTEKYIVEKLTRELKGKN